MRSFPFEQIKKQVLAHDYDLSVAFLSAAEMKKAMKYKKSARSASAMVRKDRVSNVLAFPLSKKSGEIVICRSAAKPYTVEYLFIHGLLHLKGLKHGATMEREETELLERFHYAKNSNRNRRRHLPNQGRHSAKAR
ncbi:MAG: rRNA maturation RNAse YbeY [Patescibacteria group bacterium]